MKAESGPTVTIIVAGVVVVMTARAYDHLIKKGIDPESEVRKWLTKKA